MKRLSRLVKAMNPNIESFYIPKFKQSLEKSNISEFMELAFGYKRLFVESGEGDWSDIFGEGSPLESLFHEKDMDPEWHDVFVQYGVFG